MAGEDVIKSAGRVFAVLELFDAERRPLPASEVERALGFPQSSTLVLLKSMVALGYLTYDLVGRLYAPTLRLAVLGDWIGKTAMGVHLDDLIQEISEATGETVSVSCQNELRMQFLLLHAGRNALTLNIKPGSHGPLFGSNVGRVALSCKSDDEIARLAARINRKPDTDCESVDLLLAMAEIDRIRKQGYGIGYGAYIPSIGAISWALPNDGRTGQLVISVAGPVQSIQQAEASIIKAVTDILGRHTQFAQGSLA